MAEQDFHKQTTLPGSEAKKAEQEIFPIPQKIGPYKIESLLETGGMSTVYMGTHPDTHGPVTIKTLLPKFLNNSEVVKRFLNEAEIISKTDHQNIVTLYGHGEWEEGLYIALEFIEGQSLRQYLQHNPISLKRALEIILEIAYALCHLHTHGIIHRDLKLENVLVTIQGDIKVIDFGIAQILTEIPPEQETARSRIIGTPVYMSPEQRKNPDSVSYPSDIYSLGIIAYELVLGKLSHGKIHLSLLPKGLQKALSKALQPSPEERYQDVVDFITAISAYMNSAMLEKEKRSSDQLSEAIEKIQDSQISLFPQFPPNWPHFESGLFVHKGSKYAGIYYDYLSFVNNSLGIAIGETTTRSAEGVIHISVLKGFVKALSATTASSSDFFKRLNQLLITEAMSQMFPFALLQFIPEENKYIFTSCGYGTLWHYDTDSRNFKKIVCDNPVLGVTPEASFQHIERKFKVGDQFILTSITPSTASEAHCSEGEYIRALQDVIEASPQQQVETLYRRTKFTQKTWLDPNSLLIISMKSV